MKELTVALTYTVSTLFLSALRGAETQITVELGMNLGILGNIHIYEWLNKKTNTQLTSVTTPQHKIASFFQNTCCLLYICFTRPRINYTVTYSINATWKEQCDGLINIIFEHLVDTIIIICTAFNTLRCVTFIVQWFNKKFLQSI